MPRVPDHVIDDVRSRVDIADIVSKYVKLQRAGRRLRGLCPFHSEKTPSFYVDPEKQLYYCFGCHAGGDAFRFLQEMEKAPFGEVLRDLAARVGVTLEEATPEQARRDRVRNRLFEINDLALAYFVKNLFSNRGEKARRYLKERGLTERSVRTYKLGYALPEWHDLEQYLAQKGVDTKDAQAAGLLGTGTRGVYDWMRDRIVFPIRDVKGRIVGFGGRTISGDKAKYVNTSESLIFSKRRQLYGLYEAKESLRRDGAVVLVEGYMDVIGLFEKGFSPAVASLGTAFTEEQAMLLKRYTSRVVMAYDADAAGRGATLRGLDILAAAGLSVEVVRLPAGEDPDSFVQTRGVGAFRRSVDRAVSLVQYKLDEALRGIDLGTVEGRVDATARVIPILESIDNAVAREGYVERTAARIGVTPEALAEELARRSGGDLHRHKLSRSRYTSRDLRPHGPVVQVQRQTHTSRGAQSAQLLAERDLMICILKEPATCETVRSRLGPAPFGREVYNALFRWCAEQGVRQVSDEPLASRIADPELARTARALMRRAGGPAGPIDVYIDRVVLEKLRSQVKGLEAKLTQLMQAEHIHPAGVDLLLAQYKRLRDLVRTGGNRPIAS